MKPRQTFTVQSAYVGRDGQPRCYVKNRDTPLLTDTLLNEGDAVVIRGDRAERPK